MHRSRIFAFLFYCLLLLAQNFLQAVEDGFQSNQFAEAPAMLQR